MHPLNKVMFMSKQQQQQQKKTTPDPFVCDFNNV